MAFFGNRTTGGSAVNTPPANNKAVSKFVLDIAGTVDHVNVVFSAVGSSPTVKAVIYDDTGVGGLPGALVAVSNQVVPTTGVVGFTFGSPPVLAAGSYWVGVISNVANTSACAALTGGIAYNANTYASGPTNPFGGSPSLANFVYPINVVFTPTLTAGSYLGELLGGDTAGSFGASGTVVLETVSSLYGGTISGMTFYTSAAYGSAKVKGVIYDATGTAGAPGALLGTTNELTGVVLNRNTLTFPSPVSVPAGTIYIGLMADTLMGTYTRSAASSGFTKTGTYASGPPNPLGTGTVGNTLPAMWSDFTPAAAPGGGGSFLPFF